MSTDRVWGSCWACGGQARPSNSTHADDASDVRRILHHGACRDRFDVQNSPTVEGRSPVEEFDPTVTAALRVPLPEVNGIEPPVMLLRMTVSELVDSYLGIDRTTFTDPPPPDLVISLAGRHIEPKEGASTW